MGESAPARPMEAAIEATIELLRPGAAPARPATGPGYLDLLEERDPIGPHPGQQLMGSRLLPLIYERLWRPVGGKVLLGMIGPGTAEEHRLAREMLEIEPGDRVLDVGCGPGNFTRDFARAAGDGLVVGLDASRTMLASAVESGGPANIAYVRGDASALPFREETFDAVCCFAALYLIEEPMAAIDEIARVLAPGGRVALLASCARGPLDPGPARAATRALTGIRLFGEGELSGALAARGLAEVNQRVAGLGQFVWARKPGDTSGSTKEER
jgi:SAM-dependent methyltransferase